MVTAVILCVCVRACVRLSVCYPYSNVIETSKFAKKMVRSGYMLAGYRYMLMVFPLHERAREHTPRVCTLVPFVTCTVIL